MTTPGTAVTVFWSYAHQDELDSGGDLLRLAEYLNAEYRMLTGYSLNIVSDRSSLEWGDQWREVLDGAIQVAPIFVGILTPTYFLRPECRRELQSFLGQAESLGASQLFLPIRYVDIEDLSETSEDALKRAAAATQNLVWTELRMLDSSSSEHRRAVHGAAIRLKAIVEEFADTPVVILGDENSGEGALAGGDTDGEDVDGGAGLLESLADAEDTFPTLSDTIQRIGTSAEGITLQLETAGEQAQRATTARQRLIAAEVLSRSLDSPSREIERLCSDFLGQLYTVNPGVLALIRLANTSVSEPGEELDVALSYFETVLDSSRQVIDLVTSAQTAAAGLSTLNNLSRNLRRPIARIVQSLQMLNDARQILDEWVDQVERSPLHRITPGG